MRGNCFTVIFGIILCIILFSGFAQSAQSLIAARVKQAPVIDGLSKDKAWESAKAITVRDKRVDVDVTIKTVYTKEMVFFLVRYPDSSEDRLHKPWVWNKEIEAYMLGPQREDTFTFKWNIGNKEVDLSNFSDDNYTADIWYYKANRTCPCGYADDKFHILSSTSGKKSKKLTSKTGKKRYLVRIADEGISCYKKRLLTSYQGELQNQYESRTPEHSRADIRAKGVWKNEYWTIEFGRKLNTGHADDIRFDPVSGKKYQFGISIAGLYGEVVDKTKPHWYGQGRISETLYLVFQ